MSTPSQIKTSQIRVRDTMKTALLPVSGVDGTRVNILADDYQRNGTRRLRLVVPFLKKNSASRVAAARVGGLYKIAFAKRGIKDMEVNYTETTSKDDAMNAVLSYTATIAEAPSNCQRIAGSSGTEDLEAGEQYSMGCELKTAMSKMISHPDDLMGVPGTPDDFSNRQGPMMHNYINGISNPALAGLNASTVGSTSVSGGGTSTGSP